METYVTQEQYLSITGATTAPGDLSDYLIMATAAIDALTFNKIRGIGGLDRLTAFQKDRVVYVCCKLAKFTIENEEAINQTLKSYSINGVSQAFDGTGYGVDVVCGVVIPKNLYEMLKQTGLCYRGV